MTGTALHTYEILQRCMKYLVLNKIVIASTVKNSVLILTWVSVINMRICNVLLNFFVSVYIGHMNAGMVLEIRSAYEHQRN